MKNILYFSLALIAISCNNTKTEDMNNQPTTEIKANALANDESTNLFKSKVIVILSKPLDGNSKTLNLQDYEGNGTSFIPVFTSQEKFKESTKGMDIGKSIIEIDGMFLLSILKGEENLKVNPELADEKNYKSFDLISKYSKEIETLKAEMNKSTK